jgi:hypothetical protein
MLIVVTLRNGKGEAFSHSCDILMTFHRKIVHIRTDAFCQHRRYETLHLCNQSKLTHFENREH